MLEKFLFLLEEFSAANTAEIGTNAKMISKLRSAGVVVPKSLVIPKNTLKVIAHANNISVKVFKIIQETDFQSAVSKSKSASKLNHLIKRQSIPKELAKSLLKTYHQYLKSSYITVSNSDQIGRQDIILSSIKGDTNFTDVVLEVWASCVDRIFRNLNSKTDRTHDLIFPTQILVKQEIEADSSGIAVTFDIRDGSKNRVTIKSCYGIYDNKLSQDLDVFIVDIRTHNVVKKVVVEQKDQLKRSNEKLKTTHTKKKQQGTQSLSDKQVEELTKIVVKIKRLSLDNYEIYWGLKNGKLYIDDIHTATIQHLESKKEKHNTNIKLFTSVRDLKAVNLHKEDIDGIAILNTGQLLTITGEHPVHVSKSRQKGHLVSAISRTITKYLKSSSNLNLLYRSQNLTSLELQKLKYSTNYEVEEPNPDLGFRGASRIIGQPKLFELELKIIKEIIKSNKATISLVIPFVRSPGEATQIIRIIEKSGLTHNPNFEIWFELSTPENILNISSYPLKQISGLVFNTKDIHSLLHGIDPKNTDIYSRYQKNTSLLKTLLKSLITVVNSNTSTHSIHRKTKVMVDLTDFDKDLLSEFLQTEIAGIIVNPEVTALTKECIINTESVFLT